MSLTTEPGTTPSVVREVHVWELEPAVRHQAIFAALDALTPGQAARLHVDHAPMPLFYMLQAERAGLFDWDYEEEGPTTWVVRITRRAAD